MQGGKRLSLFQFSAWLPSLKVKSVSGTENAIKVCSERKEETEHRLSSPTFKFTHLKHTCYLIKDVVGELCALLLSLGDYRFQFKPMTQHLIIVVLDIALETRQFHEFLSTNLLMKSKLSSNCSLGHPWFSNCQPNYVFCLKLDSF